MSDVEPITAGNLVHEIAHFLPLLDEYNDAKFVPIKLGTDLVAVGAKDDLLSTVAGPIFEFLSSPRKSNVLTAMLADPIGVGMLIVEARSPTDANDIANMDVSGKEVACAVRTAVIAFYALDAHRWLVPACEAKAEEIGDKTGVLTFITAGMEGMQDVFGKASEFAAELPEVMWSLPNYAESIVEQWSADKEESFEESIQVCIGRMQFAEASLDELAAVA